MGWHGVQPCACTVPSTMVARIWGLLGYLLPLCLPVHGGDPPHGRIHHPPPALEALRITKISPPSFAAPPWYSCFAAIAPTAIRLGLTAALPSGCAVECGGAEHHLRCSRSASRSAPTSRLRPSVGRSPTSLPERHLRHLRQQREKPHHIWLLNRLALCVQPRVVSGVPRFWAAHSSKMVPASTRRVLELLGRGSRQHASALEQAIARRRGYFSGSLRRDGLAEEVPRDAARQVRWLRVACGCTHSRPIPSCAAASSYCSFLSTVCAVFWPGSVGHAGSGMPGFWGVT